MSHELLLSDKRYRWISTMYFYVTASAEYAINPFKNLGDFLEVKLGDLLWANDQDARTSMKSRLYKDLQKAMRMRGYYIHEEELHKCFSDEKESNESIAHRLSKLVKAV